MTLDKNDAELFYELWLPLLDYVVSPQQPDNFKFV